MEVGCVCCRFDEVPNLGSSTGVTREEAYILASSPHGKSVDAVVLLCNKVPQSALRNYDEQKGHASSMVHAWKSMLFHIEVRFCGKLSMLDHANVGLTGLR